MNDWKHKLEILEGDITEQECDAIVNAANEQLSPGGGVSGAIHSAAGPELARECAQIGHCATGDAVVTEACDLPCRRVIHTVGPVYGSGAGGEEADLLASCYQTSLDLAASEGLRSIAFPSISTGIYGYPIEEASRIALAAIRDGLDANPEIERVLMVCFSDDDRREYEKTLSDLR
ncbi:MAG: O-acetyl-ADP-ribose deacetylase [Candidatus Eisenbacteria bacterium]|nr:O-acetyl-ADP-ribose deacetylase [Candidatus Eisenbacteria bacterium]